MAIRLIDQYPNRVGAPDADYPHGVPRNKSAPTATDGTPYEQSWFRDQEGYFQGLVESAGITPSGTPDTVQQSDYLDALVQVASGVTEIDVSGDQDVTVDFKQARISALKLTGALAGDIDLIVPDAERIYWIIDETTGGFSVTVKTLSGTGVQLADTSGGAVFLRSDGANVVRCTGLGGDEIPTNSDLDGRFVETSGDEQIGGVKTFLLSPIVPDASSSGQALGYDQAFAIGQTWQDLTGSRSIGVTYTNSTGRPIFVIINGVDTGTNTLRIDVDGIRIVDTQNTLQPSSGFAVPPGSTYSLDNSSTSLGTWMELR